MNRIMAVIEALNDEQVRETVNPGISEWIEQLDCRLFGVVAEPKNADSVYGAIDARGASIVPKFEFHRQDFESLWHVETWTRLSRPVWKWITALRPPFWGFDFESLWLGHLYDCPLEEIAERVSVITHVFDRYYPKGLPVLVYPGLMTGDQAKADRIKLFLQAMKLSLPNMMVTVGDFQNPLAIENAPYWRRLDDWLEERRIGRVPKIFCTYGPADWPPIDPKYWLPREVPLVLHASRYHPFSIVYAGFHWFKEAPILINRGRSVVQQSGV